jgi:glycyl-tRNA synthetase alpha chain
MEITQFTYFQQVGGLSCNPVAVELTYGPERLAMYLQGVDDYRSIMWSDRLTYGEIRFMEEKEFSEYNFVVADVDLHWHNLDAFEREALRNLERGLVLPAYDFVLKCSHTFNLLDSRGAVSVSQRQELILRIRRLARQVAERYVAQREELGFPLCQTSESSMQVGA